MSAHLSLDGAVVTIAVATALFYFLRRVWRSVALARKQEGICGPNCDCE
jgi:uncharacterized membrane protein